MRLELSGGWMWFLLFLATAIMFVLKVEGTITWSWWIVFMPIIAPLVLALLIGVIIAIIATAIEMAVRKK